ncbi:MAG: molybdenum cofactor biosynthesis protein MoaE [Actinomycetota bacterium]
MTAMPEADDTRIGLTADPLSVGELHDWAVHPRCGAVVVFSGTVRDHAEGREGVTRLEYEAYTEQAEPRLAAIAAEVRQRWPDVVRVGLVHRTGPCELGEPTVVVAVSSPHRPEAFAAARFAIDALKASVPIWKKEVWDGGEDWGLAATDLIDATAVEGPEGAT